MLSLNKNEIKLVRCMMTLIEDTDAMLAELEELYANDHNMSTNEFNYNYGRLTHKLAQQLGKPQIKIEVY